MSSSLSSIKDRERWRELKKKCATTTIRENERRLKRLKLTRRRSLKTLPLRRRCRQSNRSTTSSRRPVFYDRWLSSKRTSGTPPRRRMRLTWTESWSFLLLLLLCCCCCLLWRTRTKAPFFIIIHNNTEEEEEEEMINFLFTLVSFYAAVVYPMYASMKAIDRKRPDDDVLWLTYWIVYISVLMGESLGFVFL